MIVVYRCKAGGREFLLLHRAHHGPHYEGEWAWGPPSGARYPGEAIEACAARELREETGLRLALQATDCGSPGWPVYLAQAPPEAAITLSAEHDRHVWLPREEAARRIEPEVVRNSFRAASIQALPCR